MKISVPSYVIPGTYAENLRFLAAEQDRGSPEAALLGSVELLFFLHDEEVRRLFDRERQELAGFGERFGYTLHLPDPLLPEHEYLVDQTRAFVRHYVVHGPAPQGLEAFLRLLEAWRGRYGDVFVLENTWEGRFEAVEARLPDLPVCCDTGHLLLSGADPAAWATARLGRLQEIHLHGLRGNKDHQAFSAAEAWFQRLVPLLGAFAGVVNLEVFSYTEVLELLAGLETAGLVYRGPESPSSGP